jgi:hypothetical protein
MENVTALATVSIDPNLNLQLDQSPTSLSKLDIEHPGAIRSSSFKTLAHTNQFISIPNRTQTGLDHNATHHSIYAQASHHHHVHLRL